MKKMLFAMFAIATIITVLGASANAVAQLKFNDQNYTSLINAVNNGNLGRVNKFTMLAVTEQEVLDVLSEEFNKEKAQEQTQANTIKNKQIYYNIGQSLIWLVIIAICASFLLLSNDNKKKFQLKITSSIKTALKTIVKMRGIKRLFLAISIIWILIVIALNLSLTLGKFLQLLLFANMPVWLNWFAYWIYLGFKSNQRSLKVQLWSIAILLLTVIIVFAQNFGGLFCIASFPLWISWLVYWVILGFRKEEI